ncbi:MAG: GNAT family N-acetyltransferase [Coxiellaceae bacterium]|nr:GNAT family N-acetyltransferase [Coxiellaceae bacterium]
MKNNIKWCKKPPSLKESQQYLKSCVKNWVYKKNKEPYLPLFIFEKSTQEFIGVSGFHHYDWKKGSIETGYWIRTSKSNRGFMREAINALTDYAFNNLRVKKITITCDPDNIRSRNIPEKLGYRLETILLNDRKKPASGKPGNTIFFVKYKE